MNLLRKKATQEYKENVAHFLLWLLVFIIPVITMFFHTNSVSEEYNWERVFSVWIIVFVFFVAFLIHNFLLLPQIIYHKQRAIYICGTISLILFFTFYSMRFMLQWDKKPQR